MRAAVDTPDNRGLLALVVLLLALPVSSSHAVTVSSTQNVLGSFGSPGPMPSGDTAIGVTISLSIDSSDLLSIGESLSVTFYEGLFGTPVGSATLVGTGAGTENFSAISFAVPTANWVNSLRLTSIGGASASIIGVFGSVLSVHSSEFPYNAGISAEAVVPAVPLPAALTLFASGLGVIGLLGWRGRPQRRRSAGTRVRPWLAGLRRLTGRRRAAA